MRTLTYYVAATLDGRISGPDDDFSAIPVVGDHIDMILRDWRDTLPAPGLQSLGIEADNSRFDAVVMGWATYAAGFQHGVVDPYPHLDQVVVTRKHADHPFPAGVRSTTDPVAEVRRLKQQDGVGVWLCGGGKLAAAVADEIDRLVLKVNPIVLGDGPALFDGPYVPRSFTRTAVTPYESGVVITEYERT
ncbi:dihydrofolate reductase family protein [Nocardioides sp. C4-1]|uniref:dihydrofolate reductase family protein n=1 Tax=Nocardioides sp. C4-1 TaxID=3151851 RepID=UPI003267C906